MAEESHQNLMAQIRNAAEQQAAFQAEGQRNELEKLKLAAAHDKEITVAMLENQARLFYTQSMGQSRTNVIETEQRLADRSDNSVALLNRSHSEGINKIVADCRRQLAAAEDGEGKG